MAEWCKFYPGFTPNVYWSLASGDYLYLREYKRFWEKSEKEAAERLRSRTMRRR